MVRISDLTDETGQGTPIADLANFTDTREADAFTSSQGLPNIRTDPNVIPEVTYAPGTRITNDGVYAPGSPSYYPPPPGDYAQPPAFEQSRPQVQIYDDGGRAGRGGRVSEWGDPYQEPGPAIYDYSGPSPEVEMAAQDWQRQQDFTSGQGTDYFPSAAMQASTEIPPDAFRDPYQVQREQAQWDVQSWAATPEGARFLTGGKADALSETEWDQLRRDPSAYLAQSPTMREFQWGSNQELYDELRGKGVPTAAFLLMGEAADRPELFVPTGAVNVSIAKTLGQGALTALDLARSEIGADVAGSLIRDLKGEGGSHGFLANPFQETINRVLGSAANKAGIDTEYTRTMRAEHEANQAANDDVRNALPTGGKVLYDTVTDPLTYVPVGAVGKLGKLAKIPGLAGVLENPARATAYATAGAAGAAQLGDSLNLPGWAQTALTLSGAVAGGIGGETSLIRGLESNARNAGKTGAQAVAHLPENVIKANFPPPTNTERFLSGAINPSTGKPFEMQPILGGAIEPDEFIPISGRVNAESGGIRRQYDVTEVVPNERNPAATEYKLTNVETGEVITRRHKWLSENAEWTGKPAVTEMPTENLIREAGWEPNGGVARELDDLEARIRRGGEIPDDVVERYQKLRGQRDAIEQYVEDNRLIRDLNAQANAPRVDPGAEMALFGESPTLTAIGRVNATEVEAAQLATDTLPQPRDAMRTAEDELPEVKQAKEGMRRSDTSPLYQQMKQEREAAEAALKQRVEAARQARQDAAAKFRDAAAKASDPAPGPAQMAAREAPYGTNATGQPLTKTAADQQFNQRMRTQATEFDAKLRRARGPDVYTDKGAVQRDIFGNNFKVENGVPTNRVGAPSFTGSTPPPPPRPPARPGGSAGSGGGGRESWLRYQVRASKRALTPPPNLSKAGTFKWWAANAWGASVSAMSSFDVSGPGRQGLHWLINDPRGWVNAWGPAMKSMFSEGNFERAQQALHRRPNARLGELAGLDLTDMGGVLTKREGQLMSSIAEVLPWVRGSGRFQTAYLNTLRAKEFDRLVDALGGPNISIEEAKSIAAYVNHTTGRATGRARDAAPLFNGVFFSFHNQASLIQRNMDMLTMGSTPAVRNQVVKDMTKFYAAGIGFIALAAWAGSQFGYDEFNGGLDYRKANFGKVSIGGIDYDIWGGMRPLATAVTQLARGKTPFTAGGGGNEEIGALDTIGGFVRGKLSPATGMLVDLIDKHDSMGWKVDPTSAKWWKSQIKEMTIPLVLQDALEGMQFGPMTGVGALLPALLGIGVSMQGSGAREFDQRLNAISQEKFGMDFDKLPESQQRDARLALDETRRPRTADEAKAAERRAQADNVKDTMDKDQERIIGTYRELQAWIEQDPAGAAAAGWTPNKLTQWLKDEWGSARSTYSAGMDAVYSDAEYRARNPQDAAFAEYLKLEDRFKNGSEVDWKGLKAAQGEFLAKLSTEDREYIAGKLKSDFPPEVVQMKADQEWLAAHWWDQEKKPGQTTIDALLDSPDSAKLEELLRKWGYNDKTIAAIDKHREFTAKQEHIDATLANVDAAEWRTARRENRAQEREAIRAIYGDMPNGKEPLTALEKHWATIDKFTDQYGEVRWDKVEAAEAGFTAAEKEAIKGYTSRWSTPTERQYKADVEKIAATGYFDISDRSIRKVLGAEAFSDGTPLTVDSFQAYFMKRGIEIGKAKGLDETQAYLLAQVAWNSWEAKFNVKVGDVKKAVRNTLPVDQQYAIARWGFGGTGKGDVNALLQKGPSAAVATAMR